MKLAIIGTRGIPANYGGFETFAEELSTRLADDSAARSVDAGAVLGAWRTAGIAAAMDVSRDTVVKLAM